MKIDLSGFNTRLDVGIKVKEMPKNRWLGWYWLKWAIILFLKMCIDVPIIILGPGVLILTLFGKSAFHSSTATAGMYICCLFACFCLPDLITTIVVPWKGGGKDFPTFMEFWDSWEKYKAMYSKNPSRLSRYMRGAE